MPKLAHDRPHRIFLAGRSVDIVPEGVEISDDEAVILAQLEGDHGYRIDSGKPKVKKEADK